MSIRVTIPTALRRYANDQNAIELDGETVGQVLKALTEAHPGLNAHLFEESGELRNFVNVYLNEEDIRYLSQEKTSLKDGDSITIVPAVAGGRDVTEMPLPKGEFVSESELSKEEIERYSRHLIMPEVAMEGQKRLKAGKILLIGTGGLGSPLALYLAAAGVGRLGLVDFDVVDHTNLQRQIIHRTEDIGKPKLESAKAAIHSLNPYIQVDTYETMITSDNAMEIIEPYDIVIDGTDNFQTRYLVNDACVLLGKPNVYGSIFRFEGQASVFDATKGPCYRCLYPEPPPPGMVPSCAEGGVLGILPGIIGVIQATEAIKLLLGKGQPLIGRLMLFSALEMKFREMKLQKDPDCPLCGEHPTVTELIDYNVFCGVGASSAQEMLDVSLQLTATKLNEEIKGGSTPYLLDVREDYEYDICFIPNANLLPLGDLEKRINELNRDADMVVYCRSGERSAKAVKFLQEQGFKKTRNLAGGILAWATQVDPDMPKY